jgi:hypothetical protein
MHWSNRSSSYCLWSSSLNSLASGKFLWKISLIASKDQFSKCTDFPENSKNRAFCDWSTIDQSCKLKRCEFDVLERDWLILRIPAGKFSQQRGFLFTSLCGSIIRFEGPKMWWLGSHVRRFVSSDSWKT